VSLMFQKLNHAIWIMMKEILFTNICFFILAIFLMRIMFYCLNNYSTITIISLSPESAAFVKSIEISAIDSTLNRVYLKRTLWIENNISLPFTLFKFHYKIKCALERQKHIKRRLLSHPSVRNPWCKCKSINVYFPLASATVLYF